MNALTRNVSEQRRRNAALLAETPLAGDRIDSHVLPFSLDVTAGRLSADDGHALAALEKTAAAIAIKALVSLAKAGDIDHLGGGLELVPALLMTLGAWVLRGPWSNGFPLLAGIAGTVQLIGLVMFVVALVLFMRRGSMSGSPYGGGNGPRWRGQVIELPSRRRPFGGLTNTVRSLWNSLTRRRGAPPSRGTW